MVWIFLSRLCLHSSAGLLCLKLFASSKMEQEPKGAEAIRPNMVLILADDLGFSDIGCYGGEIVTDNLDRLATRGVRFTQFYNAARCWPTRAALLTGYYPQQVRRDAIEAVPKSLQGKRPAWAPLVAAKLRSLGYRSFVSGKWHIDGNPLDNGFDRSFLVEDHDRFFSPNRLILDGHQLPKVSSDQSFYATTAIADRAMEFIDEHRTQFADRPFFLYLAFTAPHFPLHAKPEDIANYRSRYDPGWDEVRMQRSKKLNQLGFVLPEPAPLETEIGPPYRFDNVVRELGALEPMAEVPWSSLDPSQKMEVHAAMIERMDFEIGRIVNRLEMCGILDDTLIVFLSDNGASAEVMIRGDGHDPQAEPGSAESFLCLGPGWSRAANTPFRRHKTWVHEGGIATPCIVSWPNGNLASDPFRNQVAHAIDWAPTLVDIAGGSLLPMDPLAPEVPGMSLKSALIENSQQPDRILWWLHEGNRAIRMGNWKLVASRDQPWELYDLSSDRNEMRNVLAVHREKADDLERTWQAMQQTFANQVATASERNER